MSWLSSLASLSSSVLSTAAAVGQEALRGASELVALDALQDKYGDKDGREGRKAAFRGLDLTFVAPRLVAMGFPSTASTRIRARNDAATVAALLGERVGRGH